MWQKYIYREFMGTRLAGESKKQLCNANFHQPGRGGKVIAELHGPAEDPGYSDGQMSLVEGDITINGEFLRLWACVCMHCKHLSFNQGRWVLLPDTAPDPHFSICNQSFHNWAPNLSINMPDIHLVYIKAPKHHYTIYTIPPCSTSLT